MQSKPILIKKSAKLFVDKYRYKAVLKTAAAHWFRPGNFLKIKERLNDPNSIKKYIFNTRSLAEENGLDYITSVYNELIKQDDYVVRVESPYLSVYTNDYSLVDRLSKLNVNLTKYIAVPASNKLKPGEVFSRKLNFQYKIHFYSTNRCYKEFVNWCENNNKIKISKKSKDTLLKDKSYYGGYFYVKDDKSLTMVKIFLGYIIKKIETITKD